MSTARRRHPEAGMTLIELLLAVTLFAAIAGSIGIVLNVAMGSLNRIEQRIDFNRRVLASQRILDQVLNGLIPLNVFCAGQKLGFAGLPNAVRFVSSYSLAEAARGRPHIVDLLVDPSPNGGVRLLMNEQPYLGRPSLSAACAQPIEARPTSFILADRLEYARFAYRRLDPGMGMEGWFPQWGFPEWPSGIRIEMAPRQWQANQILPVTVNAAILVKNNNLDDPVY